MMDLITNMVRENADISVQQSHKAIEAVLAYVIHECGEHGKAVNSAILNSNGGTGGNTGIEGLEILNLYRKKYGAVSDKLKATNV